MSGNTQPTNTEGQPATQTQTQAPTELSGVQKRIDELVAKQHSMAGQMEQVSGMNQQLMERNAQLQAELERVRAQTAAAPELPPLPEGADESLVNAIAARVQAPLTATIRKLEQQLSSTVGATAAQTEWLSLQARLASEPPAVQQDAIKLYREAKERGLQGWSPDNLVWMARGRVGVPTPPVAPQAPHMMGGGPVPNPAPQTTQLPPPKSEAEIRAMTPDQRIAYYESRVVDDVIVY